MQLIFTKLRCENKYACINVNTYQDEHKKLRIHIMSFQICFHKIVLLNLFIYEPLY